MPGSKARKSSGKDKTASKPSKKEGAASHLEPIFAALRKSTTTGVVISDIRKALQKKGILSNDPRLKAVFDRMAQFKDGDSVDFGTFKTIVGNSVALFERTMTGDLIIPAFEPFCREIEAIFNEVAPNDGGKVASYIPQLARVNPDQFAVSICTIDGQRFNYGDYQVPYCVQSTCKPVNYCLALEEKGRDTVHHHIGREPSGRGFNELTLNNEGLPHNPMINAGAIMACSLIKSDLELSDRFDHILDRWEALCGGERPQFNNSVYLSERQTADRNFALGYFMRENNAFPKNTNLVETLEFYFQCCSIEVTAEAHACLAATLANAGICPTTEDRVLSPNTVKDCLSLMYSCGMYDFSGEFAFSVGLPAKSGVAGALVIVVPNVMGITVWSPRLDVLGNSVKGIDFCQRLVERFNFHNYDSLIRSSNKKDPRLQKNVTKIEGVMNLCWAASQGDLDEIKRLAARGVNLDEADYDGRTALHLAASEGHLDVVEYLLSHGVQLSPVDRWGGTPLNDAQKGNHLRVIENLRTHGAKK